MQLTGGALLSHRVRLHAYAEEVTMLQRRHTVWRTSGATFNGSGCQRAHTRLENVHVREWHRMPLRLSVANLVRGHVWCAGDARFARERTRPCAEHTAPENLGP